MRFVRFVIRNSLFQLTSDADLAATRPFRVTTQARDSARRNCRAGKNVKGPSRGGTTYDAAVLGATCMIAVISRLREETPQKTAVLAASAKFRGGFRETALPTPRGELT
jgi:hypothetical protein